ncbi:selenocysteine-specific translation elongation factor [Pseudalkalibacillus caeni]|uniref:Selenocysteine-specific elongation factor n=1 Tax=Exobacillus caeni TaxID=2574798 RepID=A0A5R9F1J2_9BACL|nr:selenocysteine-specific translation elongation factor [Pseudalkalibacillus caeni]TLS37437.1 selenocysteine-specific translation elongation factor [Pseudalkalibacillus caeni]
MDYYTIGLAGHIDHGKTTLVKALTGIETDRLKEEKERKISIELGYAPFHLSEDMQVSVIDVPGHERFIRQMIAGVAGIDAVIAVVAADEGVMPQTKEHLEILSLLGVENTIIAVTKADIVDEELLALVKDDIRLFIKGTAFEKAAIIPVDSVSGKGLPELKEELQSLLGDVKKRNSSGALRLPIDQVFSLKGHGTVIRGTIYDGMIQKEDTLKILPEGYNPRVRQLQSQNKVVSQAVAGQRVAVNLAGIDKQVLRRGQVVVDSDSYAVTNTIDVVIRGTSLVESPIKQRSPVKLHIGTSEVMGKIVFFDRNKMEGGEEEAILCQIRLEEPIVAKKEDRFIIRRPSPAETVAGGRIINVSGQKYRFGEETIQKLKRMEQGTPSERITALINEQKMIATDMIIKELGITSQVLQDLLQEEKSPFLSVGKSITSIVQVEKMKGEIIEQLEELHQDAPLKEGLLKAELVQSFSGGYPSRLVEHTIQSMLEDRTVELRGAFIAKEGFVPHPPKQWKKRMETVLSIIKQQGLEVAAISDLLTEQNIPVQLHSDFINYLENQRHAFSLDDKNYVHTQNVERLVQELKQNYPEGFSLQEAKSVLGVSRKYLVPFLELLDRLGYTTRDAQERKWKKNA